MLLRSAVYTVRSDMVVQNCALAIWYGVIQLDLISSTFQRPSADWTIQLTLKLELENLPLKVRNFHDMCDRPTSLSTFSGVFSWSCLMPPPFY